MKEMNTETAGEFGVVQLAAAICLKSMWRRGLPGDLWFGLAEPLNREKEEKLLSLATYLLRDHPPYKVGFGYRGIAAGTDFAVSIEENPVPDKFSGWKKMLRVRNPRVLLLDLGGVPLSIVGIPGGKCVEFVDYFNLHKSILTYPPPRDPRRLHGAR